MTLVHWLHPAREVGRRWWGLVPAALAAIVLAALCGVLLP